MFFETKLFHPPKKTRKSLFINKNKTMDRCIIRCIVGLEHCYYVTDATKDTCSLRAVRQLTTCLKDRNTFNPAPPLPDAAPNLLKRPH